MELKIEVYKATKNFEKAIAINPKNRLFNYNLSQLKKYTKSNPY